MLTCLVILLTSMSLTPTLPSSAAGSGITLKTPLNHNGSEVFLYLGPYSFIVTSFPSLKANTTLSSKIVIRLNSLWT